MLKALGVLMYSVCLSPGGECLSANVQCILCTKTRVRLL